ncbi:carbohydrate-binding module family 48 protein [Trichoderma citrinoviride]|uniref:Carbohydrate-binding module family 48 protein n=1 Tax=Trichoderma citrinoviride TaxID=58853 RepID=A0A2T4BKX4_9HYPO|nr:carbohydrate-binding module family 48 protein [Trichoderma citrinoviride]PTB69963.1 carbohydrate-binding module family 48 protein [Trichoderma citrinoviride]
MGSYTFKWEHPAEEVFVTGTFDNWTKSEQLVKVGDVFQKTVPLKDASQKIYFKYVVDGNWTVNESAPKEADHEGNINNFITPEDILQSDPAAALVNTVTPQSTTAAMASEQPIDKPEGAATPSDVPGGFPVTPSTELDKPVGVNPLPAAAGAVNPFKLEPGEKVPDVGIESTNDHVKLDKESYEKSDALPGVDVADLPPVTSNLIPESSLPVTAAGDVNINTVGSGATSLGLAAQVPLEAKIPDATKVPEVVKESQEKAHVEPEAAAVPEEVADKAKVEEELKEKVPEAPATSEGTAGVGTEKSESDVDPAAAIAAAAATTGAAVLAAVTAAKDNIVETAAPVANDAAAAASAAANDAVAAAAEVARQNLPDSVKEKLPEPVQEVLAQQETAVKEETREEVSPEVPAEVKESITEAGKSPEAAANTVAVEEKKEVEAELLKEVKPVPPVDETKTEETKTEEAIDSPVTEVSNVQVTKTEVPVEELTAPVIEEPKAVEVTKVEEPQTVEAKVEAPAAEVAAPAPIDTTVASEAPKTDGPAVDTPVTETDKTEVPPTETAAEPTKADANGNGANGAHSDKGSEKKKNRFSAFFSRFTRHKHTEKN